MGQDDCSEHPGAVCAQDPRTLRQGGSSGHDVVHQHDSTSWLHVGAGTEAPSHRAPSVPAVPPFLGRPVQESSPRAEPTAIGRCMPGTTWYPPETFLHRDEPTSEDRTGRRRHRYQYRVVRNAGHEPCHGRDEAGQDWPAVPSFRREHGGCDDAAVASCSHHRGRPAWRQDVQLCKVVHDARMRQGPRQPTATGSAPHPAIGSAPSACGGKEGCRELTHGGTAPSGRHRVPGLIGPTAKPATTRRESHALHGSPRPGGCGARADAHVENTPGWQAQRSAVPWHRGSTAIGEFLDALPDLPPIAIVTLVDRSCSVDRDRGPGRPRRGRECRQPQHRGPQLVL